MKHQKVLLLVLFFLLFCLFIPKISKAADSSKSSPAKISILTRIQEGVEYFFAIRAENKIAVLEKQADKRLKMAQNSIKNGKNEEVSGLVKNYMKTKEKQDNLFEKFDTSQEVLGKTLDMVGERTIEQQKTMEEIKTNVIDQNVKNEIIQIQEQVVNQVAKNIVEVNGKIGQTEFFEKVEHVWAPGTGPNGPAPGVVYEGGAKIMFAPGTSAGSNNATQDIKGVEVVGGPGAGGSDIKNVEIKGN
jgi:hypothetical protein